MQLAIHRGGTLLWLLLILRVLGWLLQARHGMKDCDGCWSRAKQHSRVSSRQASQSFLPAPGNGILDFWGRECGSTSRFSPSGISDCHPTPDPTSSSSCLLRPASARQKSKTRKTKSSPPKIQKDAETKNVRRHAFPTVQFASECRFRPNLKFFSVLSVPEYLSGRLRTHSTKDRVLGIEMSTYAVHQPSRVDHAQPRGGSRGCICVIREPKALR